MNNKGIFAIAAAITMIVVLIVMVLGGLGSNNVQSWQIRQNVSGSVSVVDKPGYYVKFFATIWTYPRSIQTFYSAHPKEGEKGEDDSVGVTFNDGGQAQVSTMVRFDLPTSEEQRMKLHRTFGGSQKAVEDAVRAHLVNCLKNSAPIMSASENQAGRKAEFNQVVEEQLVNGLYQMKIVNKVMQDQTDQKGQPITVFATEVIRDKDGKPVLAQPSPLHDYGINVTQFSVTGIEYDDATRKQFAAKKESFLAAEKSKAQREQEVQQRLMTIEKGLREKAEVEAEANKEKAKVTIEAEQKVAVAAQQKLQAETVANQGLAVAKIEKEQAETAAQKELAVAKIRAQAAEQEALAIKTLADAQAQKIKLGGSITEREKTLAEILANRDAQIAQALATVKTPQVWMSGGAAGGSNNDVQSNLLSLALLKWAGVDISKTPAVINPQGPAPDSTQK